MEKVKFDCNGWNAPAYSCDKPGDNSGTYVQVTDLDDFALEVAREFYYWWHNQPGSNTSQGFQDWWKINKQRFGA